MIISEPYKSENEVAVIPEHSNKVPQPNQDGLQELTFNLPQGHLRQPPQKHKLTFNFRNSRKIQILSWLAGLVSFALLIILFQTNTTVMTCATNPLFSRIALSLIFSLVIGLTANFFLVEHYRKKST